MVSFKVHYGRLYYIRTLHNIAYVTIVSFLFSLLVICLLLTQQYFFGTKKNARMKMKWEIVIIAATYGEISMGYPA
jgi:hypothetical protein